MLLKQRAKEKKTRRHFFQWSSNKKGSRLNKHFKKENFLKNLLNLTETNHQINMTSEHSVSRRKWLESHLNAKSFNMFLTMCQLCEVIRWFYLNVARLIGIQLYEKSQKNLHHQQYQQKHHLMMTVMKKLLM